MAPLIPVSSVDTYWNYRCQLPYANKQIKYDMLLKISMTSFTVSTPFSGARGLDFFESFVLVTRYLESCLSS